MGITNEQRAQLIRKLSEAFAHASGYSATEDGIKQWDVVADALLKAIEGIVKAELSSVPAENYGV